MKEIIFSILFVLVAVGLSIYVTYDIPQAISHAVDNNFLDLINTITIINIL